MIGLEQSSGNNYGYADNMLVIAQLMLADTPEGQEDIAVMATNDNQETFTTLPDRGFYVLTVAGADNSPFTFSAMVEGRQINLTPCIINENGCTVLCCISFVNGSAQGRRACGQINSASIAVCS